MLPFGAPVSEKAVSRLVRPLPRHDPFSRDRRLTAPRAKAQAKAKMTTRTSTTPKAAETMYAIVRLFSPDTP